MRGSRHKHLALVIMAGGITLSMNSHRARGTGDLGHTLTRQHKVVDKMEIRPHIVHPGLRKLAETPEEDRARELANLADRIAHDEVQWGKQWEAWRNRRPLDFHDKANLTAIEWALRQSSVECDEENSEPKWEQSRKASELGRVLDEKTGDQLESPEIPVKNELAELLNGHHAG